MSHAAKRLLYVSPVLVGALVLGVFAVATCANSPNLQCTQKQIDDAQKAACDAAAAQGADPCAVTYMCGQTKETFPVRCRGCLSGADLSMQPSTDLSATPADLTSGAALTLTDSMSRFTPYAVPTVTCQNLPSYGNTVSAVLPASMATALGLSGAGPFTFMFYSGSTNNVLIVGPPPAGMIYYHGAAAGLTVATSGMSGTLPSTGMAAYAPQTGTITAAGSYSCP